MKKIKTTMRWAASFFALLVPFVLASSLYAQNHTGENIIANGSFEDSELGTDGSDVNWGVETRGDAEADFEIVNDPVQDGDKAMQITINELGDNPWFIQIFHEGAPLVSGEEYRLTVFAKASDDAMINVVASSDLGGAYHRANGLNIGTDWKEITFDFEVDNDPLYGRFMVHANFDGNEGKNIWIDNLSVVLLEEEEEEEPEPVENIVLNGSFEDANVGDTNADNWWHQVNDGAGADADFLIVDDPVQDGERAMQVTINAVGENPWFIQLVNQNSEIEPGETYHFSMYAKASEEGAKMNFTAGNTSFQQYGNLNNQTLSTEWQRFEFEFTVDDDETVGRHAMHFSFDENIGKTIWVDNLVISVAVEEDDDHDFEPADPIAFDPENIVNTNGGFESSSVGAESATGWWFGTGGGDRALADIVDDPTFEGERALRVTVTDLGDNPWDVQFVNTNIPVEPGQTYMFSVYMKASREGTVANMNVENNSFEAYNTMNAVPLSTEWREYRTYFTITDGESEMRSSIHLNFDENFQATFYIDNLRIIPHNPPALTNGGFELSEAGSDHSDIMHWAFNGQQNDLADFLIVNDSLLAESDGDLEIKEGAHALEAVVHDIGEERWSVEVKYMGANLEKDQPYKATFWAMASEDGALIRTNPMFMPGWEWPGTFDAILTTEWQKFSYYFIREGDFDDVEVPMQLGFEENIGKTIYIDNYTIVPVMEIPEDEEPTSAEELAETVNEFQLDQNYPNPFNPATTIRYAVPEASHVTLKVYDITGRLVATLVDANREAGFHHVTLDGTQLASGIYIYRMQAGSFSQTRKLTLIK